MNIEILSAFRTLRQMRSSDVQTRQQEKKFIKSRFRRYVSRTLNTFILSKLIFFISTALLFFKRILRLRTALTANAAITFMCCTENQARQTDFLAKSIIPDHPFNTIDLRDRHAMSIGALRYTAIILQAIIASSSILFKPYMRDHIIEQFNNLIFIMYYVFALEFMRKYAANTKLMIVANDHALIPLAFACAARTQHRKTAYIQHAHVTQLFPRLRFDLCILDGEAARKAYTTTTPAENLNNTTIVYKGIEGIERKMNPSSLIQNKKNLTVGVFVNVIDEYALQTLISNLDQQNNITSILIRPHPAHPITTNFSSTKVFISPPDTPLLEDARKCDFIIGGNSSFHLSVLKYGVPCLYWDNLDHIPSDYYGFVSAGILYEIRDLKSLVLSDIYDFYTDHNWVMNFQKFDASYGHSTDEIYKTIHNFIEQLS